MTPAKHINRVMGKMATTLDRAHHEDDTQAGASKGLDFAEMRAHGMQAYPDRFKIQA